MGNFKMLSSPNAERGSALVEFGIVFPIFILLFFAGYEFSNFLERWQQTTTYSRAVANNVFRECAADRDDAQADVPQRLTLCVNEQRQRILQEVAPLNTDLAIVISVYEYDADTNRVERIVLLGDSPAYPSQHREADFQAPNTVYGRAIRENEVIVIGEVYNPVPGSRLLSISAAFLEEAYASTIM